MYNRSLINLNMKRFLAIFFSLILTNAFTQTMEVQGFGRLLVYPDVGVLKMELSTIQMDFGQTIDSLAAKESQIYNQFESLGYEKNQIKSLTYNVTENTIWSSGRPRYDSGYVGTQTLLLEFSNQKSEIAKLINSFSIGKVDTRISLRFKLSESKKDSVRELVIEKAIKDANTKAKVIAKSNSRELGDIIKIQYGNLPDSRYYINTDFEDMLEIQITRQARSVSLGFAVQEIVYIDKVLITYELK